MKRIAFLISGSGSDMQSVLDAIDRGEIDGKAVLTVASNAQAYGLVRAAARGIPTAVCAKADFADGEARDREILRLLDEYNAELVVLAGYLGILSPFAAEKLKGRAINIHPALLPSYGGKGFYGIRVHRAVIEAGEKFSGATVHYVDGGTDTGEIIKQVRGPVEPGDTPETLAARVLEAEHVLLPQVVAELCRDK